MFKIGKKGTVFGVYYDGWKERKEIVIIRLYTKKSKKNAQGRRLKGRKESLTEGTG